MDKELGYIFELLGFIPNNGAWYEKGINQSYINWDRFLSIAFSQRLESYLYKQLELRGSSNVPNRIKTKLRLCYEQTLYSNIYLVSELKDILTNLCHAGIPTIPLKGPVLLNNLYSDLGLKRISDLDILVGVDHVEKTVSILEKLGYMGLSERPFKNNLEEYHLLTGKILPTGNKLVAEIHWNLAPGLFFNFQPTDLFKYTVRENFEGLETFQFIPEFQLVYLCAHYFLHHFRSLPTLLDIKQLLAKHGDSLDWELVIKLSQEYSTGNLVFILLKIINNLVETGFYLDTYHEKKIGFISNRLIDNFVVKSSIFNQPSHKSIQKFYLLYMIFPWIQATKIAYKLLFPGFEGLRKRYGLETYSSPNIWYMNLKRVWMFGYKLLSNLVTARHQKKETLIP